ncbi:MAG TPA: alpha/beta hydrolase [Acidobacteriota bacterium]|nr:alpha/beta hydrolase [Acidobacteriota bacterium]
MTYFRSFDGTKLYYEFVKGIDPKKPTIIFLHGWVHNHTVWKHFQQHFQNLGYSSVALDLRGHGLSQVSGTKHFYSFSKQKHDVQTLCNRLKLKEIILCGHSMGGMIALMAFPFVKDRVHSLILLDTTYRSPLLDTTDPFVHGLTLAPLVSALNHSIATKRKLKQEKLLDLSKRVSHNDIILWFQSATYVRVHALLACFEEMTKTDAKKILSTIHIPTLLIVGENDTRTPPIIMMEMKRMILHSHLHIIPRATHNVQMQHPKDVMHVIDVFIDNHLKSIIKPHIDKGPHEI